jgi:hypothetical protein
MEGKGEIKQAVRRSPNEKLVAATTTKERGRHELTLTRPYDPVNSFSSMNLQKTVQTCRLPAVFRQSQQ